MAPLPPKRAAFVREYLVDMNATAAAKRAGFSPGSASGMGHTLLKNPQVKVMIDEEMKRRAERVEVKADDVLRELLWILKTDIGAAFDENGHMRSLKDMPESLRRTISSVEVEQGNDGGAAVKLKTWDKIRAAELLGKHLKLFTDKIQMEHSFAELTDEQLEARKQEIIKASK